MNIKLRAFIYLKCYACLFHALSDVTWVPLLQGFPTTWWSYRKPLDSSSTELVAVKSFGGSLCCHIWAEDYQHQAEGIRVDFRTKKRHVCVGYIVTLSAFIMRIMTTTLGFYSYFRRWWWNVLYKLDAKMAPNFASNLFKK